MVKSCAPSSQRPALLSDIRRSFSCSIPILQIYWEVPEQRLAHHAPVSVNLARHLDLRSLKMLQMPPCNWVTFLLIKIPCSPIVFACNKTHKITT